MSRIIPIYKKNKDKMQLTSYRPINNLNVSEKVVESLIKQQIVDFVERNKIINKLSSAMIGSRRL